jgi:hypothetical protein
MLPAAYSATREANILCSTAVLLPVMRHHAPCRSL